MDFIPALASDSAFVQALLVVLREGFEASLVLASIVAFLRASKHEAKLSAVYSGALLGVVASIATAILAGMFLDSSQGASHVLEGATVLLASGMLLYVSYWLIDHSQARRWQAFIKGKVDDAVTNGKSHALAAAAFLAVYREGFEAVLFCQAILFSSPSSAGSVILGAIAAAAILALAILLAVRLSLSVPVRKFFLASGAILFVMAVIFAGQGIHEFQEAGIIPEHAFAGFTESEDVGFFPNAEAIGVQLAAVAGFAFAASRMNANASLPSTSRP